MSSQISRRLGAALSMAVLVSCGGGGGGTPAADISTPQGAAQALVPALSVVSSGTIAAASARGTAKSGPQRWAPSGPSLARRGTKAPRMTAKSGSVQPKAVEPCATSGSTEFLEFADKDGNSPFTESQFGGYTYIDRDCTEVETIEGDTYTDYYDGVYEQGYAEDNESIQYERDGNYVYRFTYEAADGFEGEFTVRSNGVTHTQYGATTEERIDYNLSVDDRVSFEGETDTVGFDAFLGSASEPFEISSTDTTLAFEGDYGISSGDFPDCELGRAHVSTPNPLTYDTNTGNYVGLVVMESGGDTAEVDLNADGSADVSINGGAPTTLSASEIDALVLDCPNLSD